MTTPHLEAKLPELVVFTKHLANDYQSGSLPDLHTFNQKVRSFYTPDMMTKIDAVVPGWIHMASYADQQTLIHVTSVLVALYLLPEYQAASAEQKIIMEWMVMFHDVAKKAERNKHDYVHGFVSAAIAGPALAPIGFLTRPDFATRISAWKTLTENALIYATAHHETIQDNTKLPDIVSGIDALYGQHSDAALIVMGVLFHMSIYTDPSYPTLAPLTEPEIKRYIDRQFFPILKAMMLVDSDAWTLYDPAERQRQKEPTLEAFDNIARLTGIGSSF
jgi:hypothetical protein